MTHTTTVFRQKICLKCRNNHDNDGTLCSICLAKEQRRKDRIKPPPENYLVECLIKREGDTVVTVGGMNYRFIKNDLGHSICNVVNHGHYLMFVEKMPKHYRAYRPEVDYAAELEQERLEQERLEQERQQRLSSDQDHDYENKPQGETRQNADLQGKIEELDHDSAGTDSGKTGPDVDGNSAGADRIGSGKRGGQRNRAGSGQAQVGSGQAGDHSDLSGGEHQPELA